MNTIQESLFTLFQAGLTYSVCAVVWITLMAGLYQLVRDKLRHTHLAQRRPRQVLQGQQAN